MEEIPKHGTTERMVFVNEELEGLGIQIDINAEKAGEVIIKIKKAVNSS